MIHWVPIKTDLVQTVFSLSSCPNCQRAATWMVLQVNWRPKKAPTGTFTVTSWWRGRLFCHLTNSSSNFRLALWNRSSSQNSWTIDRSRSDKKSWAIASGWGKQQEFPCRPPFFSFFKTRLCHTHKLPRHAHPERAHLSPQASLSSPPHYLRLSWQMTSSPHGPVLPALVVLGHLVTLIVFWRLKKHRRQGKRAARRWILFQREG